MTNVYRPTSLGDLLKVYQEYPDEKTGVIECKADSKGNLSDCRKLKIKFVDKFIQY